MNMTESWVGVAGRRDHGEAGGPDGGNRCSAAAWRRRARAHGSGRAPRGACFCPTRRHTAAAIGDIPSGRTLAAGPSGQCSICGGMGTDRRSRNAKHYAAARRSTAPGRSARFPRGALGGRYACVLRAACCELRCVRCAGCCGRLPAAARSLRERDSAADRRGLGLCWSGSRGAQRPAYPSPLRPIAGRPALAAACSGAGPHILEPQIGRCCPIPTRTNSPKRILAARQAAAGRSRMNVPSAHKKPTARWLPDVGMIRTGAPEGN